MSNHGGQSRLKTSPKGGPLRATMPIAFVTKEGSGLLLKAPLDFSPPSSKTINNAPGRSKSSLRRTASLDGSYIRGRFPSSPPKEEYRAKISVSLDSIRKIYGSGSSPPIENRLARLNIKGRSLTASPKTVTKSSRSSEEGLNQEIAQLTSRSSSDPNCDRLRQPTPEGRKAPVADLYKICDLPSMGLLPSTPLSENESQGSSPDQDAVVPTAQRFTNRGPPDGCERVVSKSVPILCKPIPIELMSQPRSFFTLTPSSGSAFNSLNNKGDDDENDDVPLVPDQDQEM